MAINLKVLNTSGDEVGTIDLDESVFGVEVNESVLHQIVKTYLGNQRQGTQSALTRAEVAGGGAKPWRQKGTGRARHGSIRAPQWTHGGVAFAPKPRSYRTAVNKKFKKVAMRSALTSKAMNGNIIVLDSFNLDEIKTKNVVAVLKAINAAPKTLIVTADVNKNLVLSARNVEKLAVTTFNILNVYELLKYESLVITKDAIEKLMEVYA